MALDSFFDKVSRYNPNVLENVQRVLINAKCTSPERTMTLSQIRAGYHDLTDESFPRISDPRVELLYLLTVPFIACYSNQHGTFHFFITPEKKS